LNFFSKNIFEVTPLHSCYKFNANSRRFIVLRRCRSLSQIGVRLLGQQTPYLIRVDLTTKSHGTSRKVDPGKRDIGSRDSAGRIPFIPPNRSRYIGARYTSAQISEPVTLGTGDLAGFPRASRATMRLANSFISIAD